MTDKQLEEELATLRQAVRDLYDLERRFKPASFERAPMPALQRILLEGERQGEPERPA